VSREGLSGICNSEIALEQKDPLHSKNPCKETKEELVKEGGKNNKARAKTGNEEREREREREKEGEGEIDR